MQKKLLIVDDEESTLLALKRLLGSPRLEVDVSQTLEEAEEKIRAGGYDVVIADLRLTGILGEEGLEIIQYVRDHSPQTNVILVTGYGDPAIMQRAFSLGAAFYFEKPVKSSVLTEALRSLGLEIVSC